MSGGNVKQSTDALRVYELQHAALDQAYLDQWATMLAVVPLLSRVRNEAKPV